MKPILDVKNLTMDFGGLRALDSLDIDVRPGEIAALIGPNGAGKTTFFNCVTGMYNPTQGDVLVNSPSGYSTRLNGLKPNKVTERGLARTFQNIRLFQNMTVLENVMIGRHCHSGAGHEIIMDPDNSPVKRMAASAFFGGMEIAATLLKGKRFKEREQETVQYSYKVLEKVGLEKFANNFAKNLPYGLQRRLEIARAMATEPFLLLLDEPAAGMNPQETKELDDLIQRIRDKEGISILLIEHDMRLVMSISQRIFVMDYGKKIAQGTPGEIRTNDAVIKAYLGEDIDA
ncbi:amino acid/amide ABC transporter ATP-binding protein 1, HAAT family [Desulfatibacillum alkenivorans DSM 16219]|jgi:branched-chain amino acid transport system ATP-binding protein|uniref:Amino acid/amide ABC transporter ATP-binding protein 1, HAAT family n=1 Tax=Desulfatibacillum alkenivorans DSM 16219 TaxID=1121393 RepID=A0A1M6KND1_9BACT|nr:ATP-binding cassette domain-containing protein [Desulfatibacillum alkenivorans]SHJ60412.1 amino acid/amide ABC transporter ATP-binding protein 1, HAAT family [Desulfatibacillum alkenivorans DSM 16219]